EARLRAGARAARSELPPGLHERILAAVRAAPRAPVRERARAGNWLSAAAAALVLSAAWWLTRDLGKPAATSVGRLDVVALSHEPFGAGRRVLTLPNRAEDSLRDEARNLWRDTSRTAEGIVRGLPAPLRARLERL